MRSTTTRLCAGLLALLALSSPATALPVLPLIATLFYDETGRDGTHVYTEIAGPAGYALDGWHLLGVNGANGAVYRDIALAGAAIPAGGVMLVATADALDEVLAARDFIANVDWQNGPDAVQLVNANGGIADAVQYGDAHANNAGEGTPAPDAPAGMALARDALFSDTGDNATDFQLIAPSPRAPVVTEPPGSGPAVPVREPVALWLALLPVLWWAGRSRAPSARRAG